MENYYIEPERRTEISGECDVLVCGGGVAGIAAALAAARNGAKVILLEREFMLGGLATLGLVTIYLPLDDGAGTQVSFGIAEELLKLSIQRGIVDGRYPTLWFSDATKEERAAGARYEVQYNPHVFACDAEKLLQDLGVEILYGTVAVDTVVTDAKIQAVIVENKSGRSAIRAKSVVDATGDADICKLAGAKTALHGVGNVLAAWYYHHNPTDGFRLKMLNFTDNPKNTPVEYLIPHRYTGVDAKEISDMVSLSHQRIIEDMMKMRAKDGTTEPILFPTIPQLRMTRRIVGIVTMDDKPTHEYRADSVGMFPDWRKRNPAYELSFASLYGRDIKNLICAGRNISVTDAMWDITRVIPVCAVTGEAAGTAAAMTDDFASLNVVTLQERLVKAGVKLHCADVGL